MSTSITVDNADGTHTVYQWDTDNQNSWADLSINYDSNWNPTSATVDNRDGTHTVYQWDPMEQGAPPVLISTYDAQWHLVA